MLDTVKVAPYQLLIDGQLVAGQATMPVINPATEELIAHAPRADAELVSAAVEAAHRAFPAWSAQPIANRQACLRALADEMEADIDNLRQLLTQEQGKPLAESDWELQAGIAILRHFAETDLPIEVLEDSPTRRAELHRRPLGVVAAIVPWNFPILLMLFKLPPALVTGNTIVIKPAPTTPLTTLRVGEMCARCFPAGVVNIVTDDNDLGAVLASQPLVRKISFTGSTATGKKVMAGASETLKHLTLELGGNDAAIVLDDACPETAAQNIFAAAFMNCGQVCIAVKRVYVQDGIYDDFCEALARCARNAKVGNGADAGTEIGPLNNKMQLDKVCRLIEHAAEVGKVIAGGKRPPGPGYFVYPTIVRDAIDGTRIVDEEQFGPVLPVIRFSDPEDALARANASPMGLGGSIWSRDTERAYQLASRMDAGMVWINKHLDVAPHLPFGGTKDSGIGVELAQEGLKSFTQSHVVNI